MSNARAKTVGEMSGEEFDGCCYQTNGLRPPKDQKQMPAYIVTSALTTATKAFLDRDLIEKFVIDLALGDASLTGPEYWPLVEKALGRPVPPDEPRRFDPGALLAEQRRRLDNQAMFE